jgi:methionine-rich copper-binding protein CopC
MSIRNPTKARRFSSSPSEVSANYTEPLSDGSYLKVYDPCGDQVDSGDVRIFHDEMTVSMAGERSGSYRVDWLAISDIDPHSTRGSFTFTVTSGESCPQAEGGSTNRRARASQEETDSEVGSNDDLDAPGAGSSNNDRARASGDSGNGGRDDVDRQRRGDRQSSNPNLAAERNEDPPRGPSAFDLPSGKVAIAWLVAGAIGAIGGLIYDGIMGPRAE